MDVGNIQTRQKKLFYNKVTMVSDYIFNSTMNPIIVFDSEFNIVKINTAAKVFFAEYPVGKKCFSTKHKFALACKNCPIWQTLKTGKTATYEVLNPATCTPVLLKTYPIYNRLKNIPGVVLVGRESNDISISRDVCSDVKTLGKT